MEEESQSAPLGFIHPRKIHSTSNSTDNTVV